MSDLDGLARRGISAINEKKFDEAIEAFEAALAIDEARPDLNNALGMAHVHRGDVGNALPFLERAVELARGFTEEEHQEMRRHFHVALATAYQLVDQVPRAVASLQEIIETWPEDAEAHLQYAQLLVGSCRLQQGAEVYRDAAEHLDEARKEAAMVLVGSIEAFLESEEEALVFLEAHRDEYVSYFNEVAGPRVLEGWYAEAARMGTGSDGEPAPIVAEGARPYALTRVDLVNPEDQTVSSVYSEQNPMVVAVNGLEPLAQIPVLLPLSNAPFETFVCSQCPWHWLTVTIQSDVEESDPAWFEAIDEVIGSWYLEGWNGTFGDPDSGRFHYISDPDPFAPNAVSYVVDLGRARFEALHALLSRLAVFHEQHPVRRLLLGAGRLPD
jgi:tetratricopeptide (TPR) repeat protein